MRKKKAVFGKKNLFNRLKVIGTFRNECNPKYEPLKNKQKFKPLKANELKFCTFKIKIF